MEDRFTKSTPLSSEEIAAAKYRKLGKKRTNEILNQALAATQKEPDEKEAIEKRTPQKNKDFSTAISLESIDPEYQEKTAQALKFKSLEECLKASDKEFAQAKMRFEGGFNRLSKSMQTIYRSLNPIVEAIENKRNKRKNI